MKTKIYKLLSSSKQVLLGLALTVFSFTAYSQATYTFNFTGSSQTISLPAGSYSIECWGADGGTVAANTALPGKGGYSAGSVTLTSATIYSIYVGGMGNGGAQTLGGFNSGNGTTKTNVLNATGGGGASDLRVLVDDYFNRIIVAGGGGGQGTTTGTGGNGGGLVGQNGQGTTNAGVGGSQTAPGAYPGGGDSKPATFGEGSDGPAGTTGGQGGGGWYGGSFGTRTNGGGAGGSGYVLTSTSFIPTGYFSAYTNYYFNTALTFRYDEIGFAPNPDLTGNGYVLITELCNISLYASGTTNSLNPMICSGQSLTLTTNAISNYSWSTGATTPSLVVSPTSNTVYALTATSPSNCTASRSISVSVNSGIPVLSISNPSNNICLGQTATLTASGALSYTWANVGVVNGQTFTPASTQAYTVSGENGCGITVATTTITVTPLLVSVLASPNLVCEGYPSTLTAVAAVGNYTWQPGPILGNTVVVSPTASVLYTVTASDGICSGTQTLLVNTKPTPNITASSTSSAICLGEDAVFTANGAGIGGTYSWSPAGGSAQTVTVSPTANTLYVVSGTNSFNCTSSANLPLIVNLPPPLIISSNKTLTCENGQVNLSASGAGSYNWVNGPTTSGYTVFPVGALNVYTVVGSHLTNTCIVSRTIAIEAVIPNVSVTSPINICDGKTATLIATGATTYTWNNIPVGSSGLLAVQPTITTIYSLIASTQSITVNCISNHTALVNVNLNPTIIVTASRNVICKGESNTLTATGAANYAWQGSTSTGSTVVVSPKATTIYTLSGTSIEGCITETMVTTVVNACNGIEEYSNKSQINVYPNPNNGQFFVNADSDITLNLINSLGQIIQTIKLNSENGFTVEVNSLAKGVYYLSSDSGLNSKLIVN